MRPPAGPEVAARASGRELWEQPLHETRSWPATRLASWSLMLLLWLSVLVPTAVGTGGDWGVLALAALVAAPLSRALFEVLGVVIDPRGAGHRLVVAAVPALVATAVIAATCWLVGRSWSPPAAIGTAALSCAVLLTARAVRTVEIASRRRMRCVYFVGSQAAFRDLARELVFSGDRRLVGSEVGGDAFEALAPAELVADVLAAGTTVLVLDRQALGIPAVTEAASSLRSTGVTTYDLVSYAEQELKKVPLTELSPSWFAFELDRDPPRVARDALLRAAEVAIAALLIALTLPLLLVLGLAIRLTSPGPSLYRQRRTGKHGKPFTLLKLRTMTDVTAAPAAWATVEARRVTPIGRPLRRFRIDELPQFWNVLMGDLALIGPRPEQVPIIERLEREVPHYDARHGIRPGITGWAQVNLGYGGSLQGSQAKLSRDLFYLKHRSLRLDALIVWLTLKAVLAGRG